MIKIDEHTNRVLNIVKSKYGLKNRSAAIERIVSEYEAEFLEPELRPEFVEKMKQVEREGFSEHDSLDALRRSTDA